MANSSSTSAIAAKLRRSRGVKANRKPELRNTWQATEHIDILVRRPGVSTSGVRPLTACYHCIASNLVHQCQCPTHFFLSFPLALSPSRVSGISLSLSLSLSLKRCYTGTPGHRTYEKYTGTPGHQKLPVALNPQKTHPQRAVPSPCWAFMFWGTWETEESKMNREL